MSSFTRTTGTRRGRVPAIVGGGPGSQATGLLVLGRYRLYRPLGAGGFGTVWVARDERLERDVAVKVLPRDRILDGRFEREARAAARLSHPGIVTLYEAAVDDDGAYLVSELVRGVTLSRQLEAGRLSDRDVVEIGIALADALAHAHAHRVVHRDVKPSNVLVPDHPESSRGSQPAKLTDFGVARLIGADTLTRTGDVIGTAAYMAPEQADGREAGAAADLYSLALVLYEALTGVNPLALGSAAQRTRRLGAHLPPLRRQRRDLPGDLGQALDMALRPRARERGSIDELRAGLERSLGQVKDRAGVVAPAWSSRSSLLSSRRSSTDRWIPDHPSLRAGEPPASGRGTAEDPEAGVEDGADPASRPRRLRSTARLLAGVTAGATAAWLVNMLLPGRPGAVAAAGVIAGVCVAALPRVGWLTLTLALAGLYAARGNAGAAVLVGLAALLPAVLMLRAGASWPLGAVAVGLGGVSLAGGWPALAARASGAWHRAALGAVGWAWTLGAGVLVGHGLYTRLPSGLPSNWRGSLTSTLDHVFPRILTPGLLAPALLWALAAMVLPWLASRWRAAHVILITVWSAGLASGTATMLRLIPSGIAPRPGVVALGAVLSWLLALGPSLIGWAGGGTQSADTA